MTLKYKDGRTYEDCEIDYARDVCDSFFSFAWNVAEDRKCTDDELDQLTTDFPDVIYEAQEEHKQCAAEAIYDEIRGH